MARPWNDWYHCIGNTYGTWLPGDPRGFRTRHHREHVEGDYKNPPIRGRYDRRYERAKSLMNRRPFSLDLVDRKLVLKYMLESLAKRRIEVLAGCVDRVHFHLLVRALDHDPRRWIGLAKKESSHYFKVERSGPLGGIWAASSECIPVTDRSHQLRVFRYILTHKRKGAATWTSVLGIPKGLPTNRQPNMRRRGRVRPAFAGGSGCR